MSASIIDAIDKELEQLQRVRAILAGAPDTINKATDALSGKRRGRPAGSKNLNTFVSPLNLTIKKRGRPPVSDKSAPPSEPVKAKRVLSDEARNKIAEAQKKRWASAKRAAKKAAKEVESGLAAKKVATKDAAKKAVTKKVPAKKAPATKAPAAKKVTAKRVIAKKVTTKKAVVKRAPLKSVPATPTPPTESQSSITE